MGEAKRQEQCRGFSSAGNVTNVKPVRPPECKSEANVANEEAVGSEDELVDGYVADGMGEALEQGSNAGDTIASESDVEEAVAPRGLAKIYIPTAEEFERHCLIHLPYRNWCPKCIQAKRQNPGHRKSKQSKRNPDIQHRLHVLEWKRLIELSYIGND